MCGCSDQLLDPRAFARRSPSPDFKDNVGDSVDRVGRRLTVALYMVRA